MLKIYGVYQSRASRVYWAANELGLEFESIPVIQSRRVSEPDRPDAPLNTRSAAFTSVNPSGLIPAIDDDGMVLTESLAITQYLAKKHGGPLAPQTAAEDGQIMMWSLWAATNVEPHTIKIVLTHDANQQSTPGGMETIAVATRLLRGPMTLLNAHLTNHSNLVGNRFTIADLNVCEVIRYAMSETEFMLAYPHIMSWYVSCHNRPAFQKMWKIRSAEGA